MSERKKVLVVDDSDMIRDLLEDLLSEKGYIVTILTNGRDVLHNYRPGQYDAIIMDTQMPDPYAPGDFDGDQVCEEVRKIDQEIKIIGMSSDASYRSRWEKVGANTFIHKPRLGSISTILEQYLGKPEL